MTTISGTIAVTSALTATATLYTGVSEIQIDPEELTMDPTDTETITATVLPAGADTQDLIWESEDTSIATVTVLTSTTAEVEAVSDGRTSIMVYIDSDNTLDRVSAVVDVTVNFVAPTLIGLSLNRSTVTDYVDAVFSLRATEEPENAEVDLTWTSTDTGVATVADYGKEGRVTAVGLGETTIRAEDGSTGVFAECVVEIVEYEKTEYTGIWILG